MEIVNILHGLRSGYGDSSHVVSSTVAETVDPSRAALPSQAGSLRLTEVLCPERAAVAADLRCLVRSDADLPFTLPRACHAVLPADEVAWVKTLLRSGMGALIEEPLIPRDRRGRLILAGWFGVPHTRGRQRLIFDRRASLLTP